MLKIKMTAESIVDIVHCLRLPLLDELEGQLLVMDVGGAIAAPAHAPAAELALRLAAQLRGGAFHVDIMLHQLCLLTREAYFFYRLFLI